ncbi:radical SAM protein [Streptomyces sp. 4R-3d]|uniref:radical SAM/SPASM domain-containing protein n=1 Tax=Streptomyces sp. 4R-3d TaxID=2559605 RepID=UPI0010720B60|nr:radical SAM protein [Streptomyces sp. 4R-3d]TFI24523.1 radical SAM protein [Streptomyces sp. 4R-3d]
MGYLRPTFAWLEITGLCNENCRHCYAGSSPQGDHGSMTVADWRRVIGELRGMGVRNVQFIGGEPTLHPALPELIRHAIANGMRIEVFSNLSHVGEAVWAALRIPGVRLAFSYYSDTPADHDDVTMTRGSHARTRANVAKARSLGIPLRGSVIGVLEGQRGTQARGDLLQLGVRDVRTDRIRPFGRGADGRDPRMDRLCGRCGRGKFAVSPDGEVWPCVFARWMPLGNVRERSLSDIYLGTPMRAARAELQAVFPDTGVSMSPTCLPDCNPSFESCTPQTACAPDASCGPTEDDGVIGAPGRSVRYYDPGVSGTDC